MRTGRSDRDGLGENFLAEQSFSIRRDGYSVGRRLPRGRGVLLITPGPVPAPQSASVSATAPVNSVVCSAVLTAFCL